MKDSTTLNYVATMTLVIGVVGPSVVSYSEVDKA